METDLIERLAGFFLFGLILIVSLLATWLCAMGLVQERARTRTRRVKAIFVRMDGRWRKVSMDAPHGIPCGEEVNEKGDKKGPLGGQR